MELYVNIISKSLKYMYMLMYVIVKILKKKKGHMAQNFLFCIKSTVSDFIVERLRANSIEKCKIFA